MPALTEPVAELGSTAEVRLEVTVTLPLPPDVFAEMPAAPVPPALPVASPLITPVVFTVIAAPPVDVAMIPEEVFPAAPDPETVPVVITIAPDPVVVARMPSPALPVTDRIFVESVLVRVLIVVVPVRLALVTMPDFEPVMFPPAVVSTFTAPPLASMPSPLKPVTVAAFVTFTVAVEPATPKVWVRIPVWPRTLAEVLVVADPAELCEVMPVRPREVITPELSTFTRPVEFDEAAMPKLPSASTKIAPELVTVTVLAVAPKLIARMPPVSRPRTSTNR